MADKKEKIISKNDYQRGYIAGIRAEAKAKNRGRKDITLFTIPELRKEYEKWGNTVVWETDDNFWEYLEKKYGTE